MLTVTLGPLSMPIAPLLILLALLVAAAVGSLIGRSRQTRVSHVLSDMLLAGVLAARIGFVAAWFDSYSDAPWSMLDLRDGGFTPWAGAGAALLVAIWHGWRHRALRRPLALGLAAGALVWSGMYTAIRLMENTALPQAPLTTLDGAPADLAKIAAGRPLVVNLWATWCPPCRREMPVLAAAQKKETALRFVFVNQGEAAPAVRQYLAASGLDIANVLLDSGARMGREVGSGGLPTTLFYDADGKLVDTHVGQLTTGALAGKLERLRPRP